MPEFIAFLSALAKWVGDHLAAVATFAAAIVALFKEDVVKRWRRPKLSLRLLLKPPDTHSVPTVVVWRGPEDPEVKRWEGDVYYFRFWVENAGPWPAERVQVYIRLISNRLGDNRLEEVRGFIPMNLRWSHSPMDKPIVFETLNPHMGKNCDLGSVSPTSNGSEKPLPGMKTGESTFNLATEVLLNNGCHRLKPGKYRLEILVAAQNARPKLFWVDLDWSGIFEESEERMFSSSVGISISEAKLKR
jgi:hypothetical protein